jgi:hypothetical protein
VTPSVRPISSGLKALEVWRTTASRRWEGFHFLFRLLFGVFFVKMVKQRLHLEVRIRSYSSYPCAGGASHAGGGRVESCARRISRDRSVFVFVGVVQVSLFRSTIVIIGDGCCSSALVLWGLSTTTFRLSTTTSSTTISFARLR